MPKFYDQNTGEILEYPAEAASLFAHLKPVPSERAAKDEKAAAKTPTNKNGEVDAK